MKEELDVAELCGKEFEFLSQIYIYLKKIRVENLNINFDVLFEFLRVVKEKEKNISSSYIENFIFIEEIKASLNEFSLSEKNIPNDDKLVKLSSSYPVEYNILLSSLL